MPIKNCVKEPWWSDGPNRVITNQSKKKNGTDIEIHKHFS